MTEEHQIIYFAKIVDTDKYALVHWTERKEHFNMALNYDNLTGYLEGAFAMEPWNIEIANGLTDHFKSSYCKNTEIERLDTDSLNKLIDDAGIHSKLEYSIRCY